jgi:hypothetical protein
MSKEHPSDLPLPAEAEVDGADNRGRRPGVTAAGEVTGSGAGAGGGGNPEEIDSDSAAGGAALEMPKSKLAQSDDENSNT